MLYVLPKYMYDLYASTQILYFVTKLSANLSAINIMATTILWYMDPATT